MHFKFLKQMLVLISGFRSSVQSEKILKRRLIFLKIVPEILDKYLILRIEQNTLKIVPEIWVDQILHSYKSISSILSLAQAIFQFNPISQLLFLYKL